MPVIDSLLDPRQHLKAILSDQDRVTITRGELERLRCLQRELWNLKALIHPHPPCSVLITAEALQGLLDLV